MNSDLSIIDVIALVFRNKLLVFGLTVLGAAAGIGIGMTQQPVYSAKTLLSVVEQTDSRGGLAELASKFGGLASGVSLGGSGSERNVTIAILRSRAFIVNFIRTRGIEKALFADRLGSDGDTWLEEFGGAPTDNDVYDRFVKQVLAIREDKKTGLVTVSMDWFDPSLAADWANGIVKQINEQLRARARSRARKSIEYLESEVARTSNDDTRQAIYHLIEQQINEIMLANVTEEYAFEVLDPATPSDLDDYVKPRKLLLLVAGTLTGALLAVVIVIGRLLYKLMRANPNPTT